MPQQTINIPDGFELIKTSETTFEIKKKEKQLPKTWEEFCKINPIKEGEAYICNISDIQEVISSQRHLSKDKNFLPTRKDAEGILALMQLIQLRDYYNEGWRPDWTDDTDKYAITRVYNRIGVNCYVHWNHVLTFKTEELRYKFLENFKDLIEQAKDFI